VIYLERGKGKTRKLIEKSARTGFYIVCPSLKECSRIFGEAQDLKFNIPFPISFDEFIHVQYHPPGIKGFLIDNADMLLDRMSRVPIGAITLTKDEGFCEVDCIRESGYPCIHIEECGEKAKTEVKS